MRLEESTVIAFLTLPQEETILSEINAYAQRGTLLTPAKIAQLAEELCGTVPSKNWASKFIGRYEDRLDAKHYTVQEAARLKADTPETRRVFYQLAHETIVGGNHLPQNIYNMDEVGFELSSAHRRRSVAPKGTPIKAQTKWLTQNHITVVAAISTTDAPVPPLILYPGTTLIEEWFNIRDATPNCTAMVTTSGFSNAWVTLWWLQNVFDPATRSRAQRDLRLLILDGAEIHTSVKLIRACWTVGIVLLFLPANLSAVFQPLDVQFFRTLKGHYNREVHNHMLGSNASGAPKGLFYRWFQMSWRKTINPHQITAAWRQSGLWPVSKTVMRAVTPPIVPANTEMLLATPQSAHTLQALDRGVRQGKVKAKKAFFKVSKAFAKVEAENILLRKKLARQGAAEKA